MRGVVKTLQQEYYSEYQKFNIAKGIAMLAELKDRAQVTIPKSVVTELGLRKGDQFEVVVDKGAIRLVPVVVYPKEKIMRLEKIAAETDNSDSPAFKSVISAIKELHEEL